jgi:hypothetical protein
LSLNYGQRIAAPSLSYRTTARLPLRIVTLLFPVNVPDAAPPEVEVKREHGVVTGLVVGGVNKEVIRVGSDLPSVMYNIRDWNI